MTSSSTAENLPQAASLRPGPWWILAFAGTAGIGWVVNLEPIGRLRGSWEAVAVCGGWVAIAALVASLLQAGLLSRSVCEVRAWVPYSVVGAWVGYWCIGFFGRPLADALVQCPVFAEGPWLHECSPSQETLRRVLAFAAAGAGFGALQAIALRRWVSQAWICIPFSAAALAAAGRLSPYALLGRPILADVLTVWGAGAAGGLIKGTGLAFLLRIHPRSRPGWAT
jgi:hypothetical protein